MRTLVKIPIYPPPYTGEDNSTCLMRATPSLFINVPATAHTPAPAPVHQQRVGNPTLPRLS